VIITRTFINPYLSNKGKRDQRERERERERESFKEERKID
jgi:hypothetical protein